MTRQPFQLLKVIYRRFAHKQSFFLRLCVCVACGVYACDLSWTEKKDIRAPHKVTETGPKHYPVVENIILITVDTLRADYVGFFGGQAQTPVLDKMASDGWAFSQCYATSMLTNPSHASIMTSVYPQDHGVYDNESGIQDGSPTLAAALDSQGFETGALINFPHLEPKVSNLGQGFGEVVMSASRERQAQETTDQALALIDRLRVSESGAPRPFFSWLHYTDPHAPYEPSGSHAPHAQDTNAKDTKGQDLERAFAQAPGFILHNPWFKEARQRFEYVEDLKRRYIGEIEATDEALGNLFKGLATRQLTGSTVVVVTSDHGENMGEHGLYFHHGGLYRPTVHVPLIISVPGAQPRHTDALVSTVDIAPTLLELAGQSLWPAARGKSLWNVATERLEGRPYVYFEHMQKQLVGVRSAQGSLIVHRQDSKQFPAYPFRVGKTELYDLSSDPGETLSLIPRGKLAAKLSGYLNETMAQAQALLPKPAMDQDLESLRELGYLK
jgi:arylsulfatase